MCLEAQGICIKILIATISPSGFLGNKMDGQQWRAWAVGTVRDEDGTRMGWGKHPPWWSCSAQNFRIFFRCLLH